MAKQEKEYQAELKRQAKVEEKKAKDPLQIAKKNAAERVRKDTEAFLLKHGPPSPSGSHKEEEEEEGTNDVGSDDAPPSFTNEDLTVDHEVATQPQFLPSSSSSSSPSYPQTDIETQLVNEFAMELEE